MNVYEISPDFIKSSDENAWAALQVIVNDNPELIQPRLVALGYNDAPDTAENLFQYIYDGLNNGRMNPADLQAALNNVPITHPKPKSGDGQFWNTLGQVGGVVLSTLFPATQQQQQQKPAAAAAAQTSSNNTLLWVALGGVVVILAVVLILKSRK